MTVIRWDMSIRTELRRDPNKVKIEELRYRNQKIVDLYSGDADFRTLLIFFLLYTTENAHRTEPIETHHQVFSLEGRIEVDFDTPNLVYPHTLEGRYQIISGLGDKRSIATFSYQFTKTMMPCSPLGHNMFKNPTQSEITIQCLNSLRNDYGLLITIDSQGHWTVSSFSKTR
ncbi:MAG: putative matrix protein [Hattula rhabdovirus]|uniref:Matrix protein n=1 Tax=Hattula rhabdovirus TaxID=2980578 RepID=A0AAE9PA40_9RHAB|nr:MAG: putative matrix protein [Hattula rhabdovirus]